MRTNDQVILEKIYESIRNHDGSELQITITNEDLKRIIKKAAPYAIAASMASSFSPNAKGSEQELEDFRVDKASQFSSLTPKEFYNKAKKQEQQGNYSKKIDTEVLTKSIKTYLIKKLNGAEELRESTDVYVDITSITDKEDGSVMVTVEITGKILANSQQEANNKAAKIIKSVLEETNFSVSSLIPLYSENTLKPYNFNIRATLMTK